MSPVKARSLPKLNRPGYFGGSISREDGAMNLNQTGRSSDRIITPLGVPQEGECADGQGNSGNQDP